MTDAGGLGKRILVTGGAGFIGSAVVREIIAQTQHSVLVVDKLTYAGNLDCSSRSPRILAMPSRRPTSSMRRA